MNLDDQFRRNQRCRATRIGEGERRESEMQSEENQRCRAWRIGDGERRRRIGDGERRRRILTWKIQKRG